MSQAAIVVTGGAGFLGRNVIDRLRRSGYENVLAPRSSEVDLTRQSETEQYFEAIRPSVVIHAAAEVGGIAANARRPGRFFYANAMMGLNVIEAARAHGCSRVVYIGTVASYPADTPIPFRERNLFDGRPAATSESYGVAKRSIVAMLDGYAHEYGLESSYLLLSNLYGPGDNFDPSSSHVVASLVRKFDHATRAGESHVEVWGDGAATRDFVHVSDAARAAVLAIKTPATVGPINVGTGIETSIAELATMIAEFVEFSGRTEWLEGSLVGPSRRRVDTTTAARVLGFSAEIDIRIGLEETIRWWQDQRSINR